jgi:hypothetical protein
VSMMVAERLNELARDLEALTIILEFLNDTITLIRHFCDLINFRILLSHSFSNYSIFNFIYSFHFIDLSFNYYIFHFITMLSN